MRITPLILLLQSAALCFGSGVKHLVVFGDSYSDVGNFKRLSNGPLWNEYLSLGWDASLLNFAFDGAVCDNDLFSKKSDTLIPSIKDQIEMYYNENSKLDPSETVHVFWVGINDIHRALQEDTPEKYWPLIVKCISEQIRNIRKVFGSNRLIVLNVPPLEAMPYFAKSDSLEPFQKAVTQVNDLLDREVKSLNQHHKSLELDQLDSNSLIKDMVSNPEKFGMINAKDAYWQVCQGRCEDDIDKYLWWDQAHLTSGAHRAIANAILLSGSLEPSTFTHATSSEASSAISSNEKYQSPKFEPKTNTGLIDQIVKKLLAEKEAKEAAEQQEKQNHALEDEGDSSFIIYSCLVVTAILCLFFFLFVRRRQRAASGLASLSGLLRAGKQDNSNRGRFIPLRSVDTSA